MSARDEPPERAALRELVRACSPFRLAHFSDLEYSNGVRESACDMCYRPVPDGELGFHLQDRPYHEEDCSYLKLREALAEAERALARGEGG